MDDLKSKCVLLVAHPMFLPLAEFLGEHFSKCYLFMPGQDRTFPFIREGEVGFGLPNVERVESIWGPHLPDCELIVFGDLYFSKEQIELERQGYRVWGARNGEELETHRDIAKKVMENLGLPVQPWKKIKGMKALRAHLAENKDQHVKINRYRGDFETFFAPNLASVESRLDAIAHHMGPLREIAQFIVEDDLPDCVEVGLDTYCIDGEWPEQVMVGIEVKDLGYVGEVKAWKDIPEPIRRWNEKMAAELNAYGVRGFVSTEKRICGEPFMIDATMRQPSPPGELYQGIITNLPEILWEGANGVMVQPKYAGKWGCEVILKSEWAKEEPIRVDFPPEFKDQIKIFNSVILEGALHVIPQGDSMAEFGAVIGWGDTLKEAVDMVRKAGESIVAHKFKFALGPVELAQEQMAEINEVMPVFDLEQSKEPA